MLYDSPTAELEMKSPTATVVPLTLARYSSTVVARLLFDALPNFFPRGLLHFWPNCFHCVARYGETPKQGARIATGDRLVFVKCSPLDLRIGFLRRHPAGRGPLATEDTPANVHLSHSPWRLRLTLLTPALGPITRGHDPYASH